MALLNTPETSKKGTRIAALDLGSNTCRLIISEVFQGGTYKNLEVFSRIVRLAENLSRSERLSPLAMERTITALRICSRKISDYQPLRVRCVATEACRRAHNIDYFKKRVQEETRLRLEVISPHEEAYLCLKGCESLLNPSIPYALVFDIGGGSSEVMWVKVNENGVSELLEFISLPFGVVGLSETYGPYMGIVFDDLIKVIGQSLKKLKNFSEICPLIADDKVQMIGCSGTATTIAALKLNLSVYDRSTIDGTVIKQEDIEKIRTQLCLMTPKQRAAHPCIGSGRGDLVIPGLSIFAGIYDIFSVKEICVADRGVRDGIIATLAHEISPDQDQDQKKPYPKQKT